MELKNNDVTVRTTSVDMMLRNIYKDSSGKAVPKFLLSRKCEWLRGAMNGGYCLETITLLDGTKTPGEKPDKKSRFSHVADALQYLVVGSCGPVDYSRPGVSQKSVDYSYLGSGDDFGCI